MAEIIILKVQNDDSKIVEKIMTMLSTENVEKIEMTSSHNILVFPGLTIDLQTHNVFKDTVEIHLTLYEYQVLCYLACHAGWIRSKQQIFEAVWHETADIKHHAVETVIYQIRKKIESDFSNPRYIQTVVGHGYKFIAKQGGQF